MFALQQKEARERGRPRGRKRLIGGRGGERREENTARLDSRATIYIYTCGSKGEDLFVGLSFYMLLFAVRWKMALGVVVAGSFSVGQVNGVRSF